MVHNNVLEAIGHTPIIKLNRMVEKGSADILVKFEGLNVGGSINKATESAMKQSAQIMQSELKSQMQTAKVPSRLISSMPNWKVETDGNRVTAFVGYEKGAYDPKNPSDAYLVVFLNYGTPNRSEHGKVAERGFIDKAKKKATPKIKKEQKKALEKILARLQK